MHETLTDNVPLYNRRTLFPAMTRRFALMSHLKPALGEPRRRFPARRRQGMYKSLCSRISVASGILVCVALSISIPAFATPIVLISESGQQLASVFDGLKSNPAFQADQLAKLRPLRRPWRGLLSNPLPSL